MELSYRRRGQNQEDRNEKIIENAPTLELPSSFTMGATNQWPYLWVLDKLKLYMIFITSTFIKIISFH